MQRDLCVRNPRFSDRGFVICVCARLLAPTYAGKHTTQFKRIAVRRVSKGKSSLMIFDRHANLKYRYGNRHFWCRGYYVDTVGKNEKKIAEYIREQLQEDMMEDQISLKEFIDPFTGDKNPKA